MNPIRPYRINVYNRITGDRFAQFYSNQVPAKGEMLSVFADHRDPENPFDMWGYWVVDTVEWSVSAPGSQSAMEVARQAGGDMAAAYCDWAEVHVWPAQGPHWAETPRFAKVLSPREDDEDGEPSDG